MNLRNIRSALAEAKEFANTKQTDAALFDICAALSMLAEELDRDLSDIKQTLQQIQRR